MSGFFQILILSLFLLSTSVHGLRKVLCEKSSPVNQLAAGEVVLFESPNFPTTLPTDANADLQCLAVFSRSDNQTNGFFVAFTNGVAVQFVLNTDGPYFFYPGSYQTFDKYVPNEVALGYNYITAAAKFSPWHAFQAIIYAPAANAPDSPCWLNNMNFDLTDETQIIPLAAFDNSSTAGICNWHFTVPNGYKLKLNTIKFSMLNQETLSVRNEISQQISPVGRTGVITVSGTKFTVNYKKVDHSNSMLGIYAYVSAVLDNAVQKTENCITIVKNNTGDSTTSVYNFDAYNGYKNNMKCSSPITFDINKTYYIEMFTQFMEAHGEQLYFGDNYNKFPLDDGYGFIIDHQPASQPLTSINFESDGSANGAGFYMSYEEQPCACNTVFTPICGNSYTEFYLTSHRSSYCSNMNCQFEFKRNASCPTDNLSIRFSMLFRSTYYGSDNFTLNVNNKPYAQFTNNQSSQAVYQNYLLDPADTITGVFTSGTPPLNLYVYPAPSFSFYYDTVPTAATTSVALTNESPVYAVNAVTSNLEAITVTGPDADILELFIVCNETDLGVLNFYTLVDGNQFVGLLYNVYKNATKFPVSIISSSRTFILTVSNRAHAPCTFFYRAVYAHSATCLDSHNVIAVQTNASPAVISSSGVCPYTFVNYGNSAGDDMPYMRIRDLKLNSAQPVMSSFSPDFNSKYSYLSFQRGSNLSIYKDVTLRGLYNTLFLREATVLLTIEKVKDINLNQANSVDMNGILYSDNFGRPQNTVEGKSYILGSVQNPSNTEVVFTPNLSAGDVLIMTQGSDRFNLTESGKKLTITKSGSTQVLYFAASSASVGTLINYEIRPTSAAATTTFASTTTTTSSGSTYVLGLEMVFLLLVSSLFD